MHVVQCWGVIKGRCFTPTAQLWQQHDPMGKDASSGNETPAKQRIETLKGQGNAHQFIRNGNSAVGFALFQLASLKLLKKATVG